MDNELFQKYRLVLGYHGCDQSVADTVLNEGGDLEKSENTYDWLGSGIYFWEHGPKRAMEWAKQKSSNRKPTVVGAVINLGNCFDLFDRDATDGLAALYPSFSERFEKLNQTMPVNKPGFNQDRDDLKRELDCSMMNWALDSFSQRGTHFDSVRGLFPEGNPVFDGSSIMSKTHIQIAIRNPACIIGYFRPVY